MIRTKADNKQIVAVIATVVFVVIVISKILTAIISMQGNGLNGDEKYLSLFRTIVYILVSTIAYTGVICLIKCGRCDEKCFLVMCISLGMLFAIVITPLSPPDEGSHYKVSYLLANRILNDPEHLQEANGNDFNYDLFVPHENNKGAYIWLIYDFDKPYSNDSTITLSDDMWTFKYFAEYLPQALGIAIARILHANQVWTFYSGRTTNLFFYSVCVYLALKQATAYKTTLGLVATLPMSLQQAASYSSDAFINGLSLVFIATIINMIKTEKMISKKDIIISMVCIAMLAPAKVAYCPLIVLLFAIPKRKFKSNAVCLEYILLSFVLCILMLVAFSIPMLKEMVEASTVNRLSTTYTFSYVTEHPIKTLSIFATTIFMYAGNYWNGAVGAFLSGNSFEIPSWIVFTFTIILLLSVTRIEHKTEFYIGHSFRVCMVIASLAIIVLIMLMELIGWTSFGSNIVGGIQGRYFIPILPLLLLVTDNGIISVRKNIDKYLISCSLLLSSRLLLFIIDVTIG